MNSELLPFGAGGLAFIGIYLASLLLVGWFGYRARRENTMRDFFLAGRGIGFLVLLFTLYATQYSGNTLFGFTGKTYKIGYAWTSSLHFMTAIIIFYLLFAPKLHNLARRKGFITPTDYLQDRFGSPWIALIATIVMVVAISNYLIGQMMAMGRALQGLSTIDPAVAYVWGVIVLALIILVYETLGGMRAVVWTDAIQGGILIIGFGVLLFMVFRQFGTLEAAHVKLASEPSTAFKLMPPNGNACREWLSYILMVGIGGALYPQAIQRIYAARSATSLRRSLAVMAFLPLMTTLVALVVGIVGAAHVSGLEGPDRDRILAVMCSQIQQSSTFGYWLVVVLFAAILAAIMSTADSVLLSISSMLTKDIYGRFINPNATEGQLIRFGKRLSWIIVAIVAVLAILLRGTNLVKLLDRKFDLLVQLAPAFFIGIHWVKLRSGPVLLGMIVGIALSLTLAYGIDGKIWGFHAGLYGLVVNVFIAVVGSALRKSHYPRPIST